MLREITSRELTDGSRTSITLYYDADAETTVIEAINNRGSSSCIVSAAEAADAFVHPFSRTDWLDYPGMVDNPMRRPMTYAEYSIAEALECVA